MKGCYSMNEVQEPIFEVDHLGHDELLSPKPEESLWYFRDVLGMQEVARQGQSVYLRAWGEYERYSLKLTESKQAGVALTAFRAMSPQALERRVHALEASGQGRGWVGGGKRQGKAYQVNDPDWHPLAPSFPAAKY